MGSTATKQSSYKVPFANGVMTVSRGIKTKFDWYMQVDLTDDTDGAKRIICLNQRIFLTRKHAIHTTIELLKKYNLFN